MKKLMTFALFMVMLISLAACTDDSADENTYLSVEINPAMEMIINKAENVVSYSLQNEAAEIVAAGLDLVGMNYEEALHLYLNAAVDTGYIDIERNDNAVALMAGSSKDDDANAFQLQVETKLQTFFQENAIGAVVLNQGEVNEDLQELVDLYDISIGFAKLVDAYVSADETHTIEEALLMTPAEIMEALVDVQDAYMAQYRNQRQLEAQAVKDELAEALQSKVAAHRQAVTNGTAVQPDITGVKNAYLADYEGEKEQFVIRNQERVEYVNAIINGEVAEYLVGTYAYEKSSEELPYIVTYYTITLDDDGTYTESYSLEDRDTQEVTTAEVEGTWAFADGTLVLTSAAEEVSEYSVMGIRITFENDDSILITFKKS
ncbi:MAG: hypothetical protein ABII85_05315 [Bacillota bacterium]